MRQKVKGSDGPNRQQKNNTGPRASLYDSVTNRIVSELEAGRLPWVQPWGRSGAASAALPHNADSGRAYGRFAFIWIENIGFETGRFSILRSTAN